MDLLRNAIDDIRNEGKCLFVKIRLKCAAFHRRELKCYLIFIVVYFCTRVAAEPLDKEKHDFIKSIWSELTPHEVHHIFGSSEQVPNLDIITTPDIFHQKIRRKSEFRTNHRNKNDTENTSDNDNETGQSKKDNKVIEISGLGRRFNLSLSLNHHLINPETFVHVFRHDKKRQILSDDIVKSQLHCFYHGTVVHTQDGKTQAQRQKKKRNLIKSQYSRKGKQHKAKSDDDIKFGRTALNLCNGMKGFIVPNDGDSEHHYVIHPIPQTKKSKQNQHFLWRKHFNTPTPTSTSNFEPFSSSTSDLPSSASTVASCGHGSHSHEHDSANRPNDHDPHPHLPISWSKSTMTTSFKTNKGKGYRFKRSYIDDTQFQYKPLSIASDSYWFRYRTTESPSESQSQSQYNSNSHDHEFKARLDSTPNYRSLDSGDNYEDADVQVSPDPDQHSHSNPHYDTTMDNIDQGHGHGHHKHDHDYNWSKGVLVYESSETEAEEKQTPDSFFGVPFYTKLPETWPSTISKRLGYNYPDDRRGLDGYRIPTATPPHGYPQPSYYHNYHNVNTNMTRSQSGYYINPDSQSQSQWTSPPMSPERRRSRADDVIFGENWKSSLDSDIMSSAQSTYSQTRVHKDKEPAHLTIETAVFVDKDLYKHMESNFPDDTQEEVSRIVLAMINAVQLLYQDPSLGHRVDFVLKRLEVLATDPAGLLRPYDIDRFLTNFCKWQKTENPASDADPLHWDHALILTGLDLYVVHQSGKISNQVVGLAPVAGMCTRSSSCTVNEGRHFESVYVVAHEIGHNLGMRHDGPQAENECDPSSHIMSPTLGSGKITWSACSKRYLDMFLETNQSKCLLDKAKSESRLDHDADGRLPGERFDADRQCVLKYGRGSYHASQQPLEDVCRDLHCRREHYTWTSHPALEGTFCGLDMWCRAGKCTIKTSNFISSFEQNYQSNKLGESETAAYSSPKALDGVWGKWSPFTDCSSACLYADGSDVAIGSTGIRLAARRCDSPRPENGGRQCTGSDRRYKTCSTEKICPTGAPKTSISQYANEVCSRAASVDAELTGRGFMTNTDDQERACSVWCETSQRTGSRSRGWSFPDGTACQLATSSHIPNYCVAGKCQFFGCDPDSHYALSDEQCKLLSLRSNEVKSKKLFHNPPEEEENYFRKKIGWTNWETQSDCKLSCLAPAKGLELVKRQCNSQESQCSGLAISVRLCKPDKSTIISNGCSRLQTPFEYATRICSQYSAKVPGLSGIGMQLSPTKDDPDRPCRVGCQDSSLLYRFYMVNGEEGWFPAGTDCSRGEADKKTFCLGGKCVDFGSDDTPLYRMNSRLLGKLESIFQRSKRGIPTYIHSELKDSSLDQSSLSDLVERFSAKSSINLPNLNSYISETSLDFSRPILVPSDDSQYQLITYNKPQPINYETNVSAVSNDNSPDVKDNLMQASIDNYEVVSSHSINSLHWQNQPVEGSFYEWRKIVSDCSVSCGPGIKEVIVQCISGDTVVPDSLCKPRPRPGISGYINCQKPKCLELIVGRNSVWNWLQTLLAQNTTVDQD